jgi:multidrug efflux system outer membrane protein
MKRLLPGCAAAALLASCAGTPPAPPAPAPVQVLLAPVHASVLDPASATAAVAPFWRGFGDAELAALVDLALEANPDLRSAQARLREVRALARLAQSTGSPVLDAEAGASRARLDARTENEFSAGLRGSWELDLFGALAADRAAAQANVRASEAGLHAARVSVAAETARVYFELRGAQAQLAVAELSLQGQQAALTLLQARLDAGRGTALDTERARTLVANTAASVPALQATLQRSRYALATLTAQAPSAMQERLAEPRPLPGLTPQSLAALSDPQALLQRRPDIAVAEALFAAASADAAAARSRLWPTLKLSGSVGMNDGRLADLTSSQAFVWGLGASLVWNLLDGGAQRARIGAADARSEQAAIQYERAVLTALEDTAGSLDGYSRSAQQTDALFSAAQASQRAAALSRARFEAGASDFLSVLDAERERLSAADRLAQAQTGQALALLSVYRALAGGW